MWHLCIICGYNRVAIDFPQLIESLADLAGFREICTTHGEIGDLLGCDLGMLGY